MKKTDSVGASQNQIDLSDFREAFSVTPEQVAEEILECPHEAVGDNVVVMRYQPNTLKTKLILAEDDQASYKNVPMGWIVSAGSNAKSLLGVKEGDLIKFAGISQEDYTNSKVYLLMHRVNVLGKIRLDKVKSWK
jgi:co-chaperonin GroES (HSP10)